MILTINNVDYTAALDGSHSLSIERTLNAPSICQLALALPQDGSLDVPARFQHICISGDDDKIFFTGYVAAAPMPEYIGLALEGPRCRLVIRAVSDEILLDQAPVSPGRAASGLSAGPLLENIATHSAPAVLNTSGLTLDVPISKFSRGPGVSFSTLAGELAAQARGAYRAQSGVLALRSIPGTVHPLNEGDGTLNPANLTLTGDVRRGLANDITICGEHEPAAYVTEVFEGDGATSTFFLSADPYFLPSSEGTFIAELFNEPAIDPRVWGNLGGNTCFSLGAAGVMMTGGNGIDGEAQLAWLDPVEIGGTVLLEAQGISLANFSTGLLAALFSGMQSSGSCVAGFQATAQSGTGAVSLQPFVNGAAAGTSFAVNPAHQYTLRVRIHCPEQQRALTTYMSCGDNGAITTGGRYVSAPVKLLFEVQEMINGVAALPIVLYDGLLANPPAVCTVVAASSLSLIGSMRALHLNSLGSGWVVSAPANGSAFTRRLGSAFQSAECNVERTGRLVFSTGYTPAIGEQIVVTYRTTARAVGRQVNATSQQALVAQGSPGTVAWLGSVTNPRARSSADCRNAAAALAQAAASRSALWSGVYRATSFDFATDVWPGDALDVNAPSCTLNAQLIVRRVRLSYRAALPDYFEYEIAFANDWAEDLAIHTSAAVPADVWLPVPIAPSYAANLSSLTVTGLSGNTVTVNTGVTAPTGGGFEIRTRDFAFLPGEDPSLVLRGSQPNLTFTRSCAADRYYIRMFDGADPPNYSEFSAALVLNLPLSQ